MPYIYHKVPPSMTGNILFPLNTLKNIHPNLYTLRAEKYKDRLFIMDQIIPTLNCKWNDVLHLSPVHPKEVIGTLRALGDPLDFETKYFEIDASLLDPQKTTIFTHKDHDADDKMTLENFAEYDPSQLSKYSALPEVTREYYIDELKNGRGPLLNHGIPHILYKGTLDITGLKIIEV